MAVSKKQLKANRKNAQKGGVKTDEGKAIVKQNALKHGLLAKEIVINTGEGAENQEEFDALLFDLNDHFKPEGVMENMLVEKMAICHWRLKRAYRYEAGLIREKLDDVTDMYYEQKELMGEKLHRTDDEIDRDFKEKQELLEIWQDDKQSFNKMKNRGADLKETYDSELSWEWLAYNNSEILDCTDDDEPEIIHQEFNKIGWSDEKIFHALANICEEKIEEFTRKVKEQNLQKEKQKNKFALQVIKKLGGIPTTHELDKLLKYEGSIEKQFYKAMDQLERLQRLRAGDNVPAPIKLDVDLTSQNGT